MHEVTSLSIVSWRYGGQSPKPKEFVDYAKLMDDLPSEEVDGTLKTMISLHALLVSSDSQTMITWVYMPCQWRVDQTVFLCV